jgi:hypothetical protein
MRLPSSSQGAREAVQSLGPTLEPFRANPLAARRRAAARSLEPRRLYARRGARRELLLRKEPPGLRNRLQPGPALLGHSQEMFSFTNYHNRRAIRLSPRFSELENSTWFEEITANGSVELGSEFVSQDTIIKGANLCFFKHWFYNSNPPCDMNHSRRARDDRIDRISNHISLRFRALTELQRCGVLELA